MAPQNGRSPAAKPRPEDPDRAAAQDAGLRYSTDAEPGLTRRRAGRGFSYRDPAGRTIRDHDVRKRINALAIPPAWTDVWICRWPNGHLQATGRDARGRKQYRYHRAWARQRGAVKFDRLIDFAAALPQIRRQCDRDLAQTGLPRSRILAVVVRLLERTLIRIGNDEYARSNGSFGLTTFRDRHARVVGDTIRFRYRGKAGKMQEVGLRDRRLATIVRRCQDLPGQDLFQFVDDHGVPQDIGSHDVNDYLREITGSDFTAKDFRTWVGTVVAYRSLRTPKDGPAAGADPARDVRAAVGASARLLGNTPAVARASYVHPALLQAFEDGAIVRRRSDPSSSGSAGDAVTRADEVQVLRLLRTWQPNGDRRSARPGTTRPSRPADRRKRGC
jgi:DNA topoisomerase-1